MNQHIEEQADDFLEKVWIVKKFLEDNKNEWLPIETAPKDGKAVFIWYKNSFNNGRTIKAFYADKYKIESDGDCELDLDYSEQDDLLVLIQSQSRNIW